MVKRIALFFLGLALMLGVFFVYQYFSGPDALGAKKPKAGLATGPATLPMTFEARDQKGVLLYVISAAQSPEPLRDDNKQPLPGQFRLIKPLATFYDQGRVIQVRADECKMVVEQGAKNTDVKSAAAGGKLAENFSVREGLLTGHVRMSINPQPDAPPAPNDPLAGGLRVYFDGPLHLDGLKEILTTSDGIHVRSPKIDFNAQGLQLTINRKAKRFDYMSIDKGERIIIRDLDPKLFDLDEALAKTDARPPLTTPAQSQPAAIAAPKSAATKPAPTIYRLTFGQDVKAALNGNSLASDKLFLHFTASGELTKTPTSNPAATAPATTGIAPPPPPPPAIRAAAVTVDDMPETPEAVAPPGTKDLVVTWTGPMVLRPVDDAGVKLADERDVVLEALGTATKPVLVSNIDSSLSDARFTIQTGRLLFHKAAQNILLAPADFKKVILTHLNRDNDDVRDNIECGEVTIDMNAKRTILGGPGTLITKSKSGTTTVTWKTHMDLDMESPLNPDTKKPYYIIRHAMLYGALVKSNLFDMKTDTLDLLIANAIVEGKQVQALDHLVASGNVTVNTYRKDANPADGPQGGIQTRRMEIFTEKPAGQNLPVPSKMQADGDVYAWRLTDKNKGLAGLTATTTGPNLATNPATNPSEMQKEAITTTKLIADLSPPDKTTTVVSSDVAFVGLGKNPVTHLVASEGAKIEITPPTASKIVALANSVEAYPIKGTATLLAANAANPVHISIGVNNIDGPKINLDRDAKSFHVVGAGTFNLLLPPDKKNRKTATPMIITWQDGMLYDDIKYLATFNGKTRVRMLSTEAGAADQSDQAQLTCDKNLILQLQAVASATTTAPATAAATDFGANRDLDWMQADGKVEAFGAQVGTDKKLLTRLRLSVPTLRFSKTENNFVIDGPGSMVVENFRPDKAGAPVSTAGESAFAWKGSLNYDGTANTITLAKNVDFFFKPLKPFKFSNDMTGAATAPAAGARPIDMVHLHTDKLVATLAKPKDDTAKTIDSPIGFGAGGNQDVEKVDATDGAEFLVGYRTATGGMAPDLAYRVAGSTMNFDVPKNIVYMFGKDDEPAIAEQPSTGRQISGRKIILDMTKDKFFFNAEGFRGSFTGFGG